MSLPEIGSRWKFNPLSSATYKGPIVVESIRNDLVTCELPEAEARYRVQTYPASYWNWRLVPGD
jgi:hypothetical protein